MNFIFILWNLLLIGLCVLSGKRRKEEKANRQKESKIQRLYRRYKRIGASYKRMRALGVLSLACGAFGVFLLWGCGVFGETGEATYYLTGFFLYGFCCCGQAVFAVAALAETVPVLAVRDKKVMKKVVPWLVVLVAALGVSLWLYFRYYWIDFVYVFGIDWTFGTGR